MKLRRAVITAAGWDDQQLPLQRLIDRDGTPKTALQIVVEEAATAGTD
jgi:UTP--glucose-1-phosphate uridylyltransferase